MFQAKVEANRLLDGRFDPTIPALTKCTSNKDLECEV